jgi:hypothetical protein
MVAVLEALADVRVSALVRRLQVVFRTFGVTQSRMSSADAGACVLSTRWALQAHAVPTTVSKV